MSQEDYLAEVPIAWCPGCGNFDIRNALAKALDELQVPNSRVVLVTGIGQASKMAHYVRLNGYNGLHGRTIAAASAIKIANKKLVVIAESGDGDLYGGGGNHLIHNVRRNVDITVLAHDNRVYGLTKGQASPTAARGYETKAQPFGSLNEPFNPLALALAMNAGFVAQAFSGNVDSTATLIAESIRHPGFALVNILQPCPSWNRLNTYGWYKKRVYELEEDGYEPTDRLRAFELAIGWRVEEERIPIGIFYKDEQPTFEERHPVLAGEALASRALPKPESFAGLLKEFR